MANASNILETPVAVASSPRLQQHFLDYIKTSGVLVHAAEKQATAHAAKQREVAAKIPAAVDALQKNGFIPKELCKDAAEQLQDPVRVLEILINTASFRSDNDLQRLGTSMSEKKASARGRTDSPYCGVREPVERESDRIFEERLGLR